MARDVCAAPRHSLREALHCVCVSLVYTATICIVACWVEWVSLVARQQLIMLQSCMQGLTLQISLTYNTDGTGSNEGEISSLRTSHRSSIEIISYWDHTQRRVVSVSILISLRWCEPPSLSTHGSDSWCRWAVVTVRSISSRVDSPDSESSINYTCECDIISRTYPSRWSSKVLTWYTWIKYV